ncbi:MAG: GMP/IMP nucleotidase [Halieaceae bacterium]|nr:GMP/IMP nucleotidase [Halieaceae bacterium]
MIDWSQIDTVLLDMDGTLLDLHYDNYFWQQYMPRRYAEIHRRDAEESRAQVNHQINRARGTLAWYCVDHWSEQLKLDIPALKREVAHMIRMRPFVEDFLKRLHHSDKHLVLVTNAHRKVLDLKLDHTGIGRWFDEMVVSHDYQVPKEDLQFWHRFHATHPFTPARTLLIDDNEAVLDAARRYGVGHLLTLLQPDSQRDKRLDTRFPGIHHFDEIMPDGQL